MGTTAQVGVCSECFLRPSRPLFLTARLWLWNLRPSPECQLFSIPRAFNSSLGKAAAGRSIMQLLFQVWSPAAAESRASLSLQPTAALCFSSGQVESNPFPFNYVANYTVSTEVASMEFRTENGTHIPISGLDDSLAITVAVNNGSAGAETGLEAAGTGGLPAAAAVNISFCDSVVVRVSVGNSNRRAGLSVQLNFTSQQGERSPLKAALLLL